MLKLIANNAHSLKGNVLPQARETPPLSDSFIFHFQELSSNLHALRLKDCLYELTCEVTLEVRETLVCFEEEGEKGGCLAPVVACSFPTIDVQRFNEKIGFDAYLQRLVMGQFQLKILEQLLLFCEQQDAVNLTLMMKDDNVDYLEIYSRFLVSAGQVTTAEGEQTEIIIPTGMQTYDKVIDFMDKIDREFQCALWREQSVNPAFREYLKSNACL
jgi:hypothetical protein